MEQGINPSEIFNGEKYTEAGSEGCGEARSESKSVVNNTEKPILTAVNEAFSLKKVDPNGYSPLTLAFIGDSIFDVVIKSIMVERGNCQVNKLQNRTSKIVRATSQAVIADALKDSLTEEEANILRRGRNSKPYTKAKNASYSEYCKATGLEALCGYLFLKNETERLVEIIKLGLEKAGLEI